MKDPPAEAPPDRRIYLAVCLSVNEGVYLQQTFVIDQCDGRRWDLFPRGGIEVYSVEA